MTVECLVIYYLSTLDSLMNIIIKFTSLAKIITFDDMYARSLYQHTITEVSKKQLLITFHRRYIQLFKEPKVKEDAPSKEKETEKVDDTDNWRPPFELIN